MFYEAGLWIGAAFGVVALLMGNRTAAPLLASFAISTLLCWSGVPFNFYFWLVIDVAVILTIFHENMTHRDMVVIGLFLPAWALYLLDHPFASPWGTWAIVIAQFLITVPHGRVAKVVRHRFRPESDHADLMEFASVA